MRLFLFLQFSIPALPVPSALDGAPAVVLLLFLRLRFGACAGWLGVVICVFGGIRDGAWSPVSPPSSFSACDCAVLFLLCNLLTTGCDVPLLTALSIMTEPCIGQSVVFVSPVFGDVGGWGDLRSGVAPFGSACIEPSAQCAQYKGFLIVRDLLGVLIVVIHFWEYIHRKIHL